MNIDLSYCVVNNDGREYLLECLAAIKGQKLPGVITETLVLDNASTDGSAEAVREMFPDVELIELETKAGKAANDTTLMKQAQGRYCLLLNEDSELKPGAAEELFHAMEANPKAGAAGAQLFDGEENPYACAWRFPGVKAAIAGALFVHARFNVQSTGKRTKPVDWVQSSAMIVRRHAAEEIDFLDPDFFVYADECDFCKRLSTNGWVTLYVPSAAAVHHNQLSLDLSAGLPRIVEFHRNRDLYVRKHHGRISALLVRILTAWTYGLRTVASLVLPRTPTGIYWAHARQALMPSRGDGIRDRVERSQKTGSGDPVG